MKPARQLNIKFLACLLVAIIVLGVGVYYVHAFQVQRNREALKAHANRALEEQDPEKAVHALRVVVGYDNNDLDAKIALAESLEAKPRRTLKEQREIYKIYEDVLRQAVDRHDIRRRQVKIALALGRYGDAIEHLNRLLTEASADDSELEHLLARCYVLKNDHEQAVDWYQKAIEHDPTQVTSYVDLAEILRTRLKDPARADLIMEQLVQRNQDNAEAHLARAKYLQQRGSPLEERTREVAKGLELAPDDPNTILEAAKLALSKGELDLARNQVEHGLALHPANAEMYRILSSVEVQEKHLDEAVAVLRKGLEKVAEEGQTSLQYDLARLLIVRGETSQAEELIASLQKRNAPKVAVDELTARLFMKNGQYVEATRLLEKIRPAVVTKPELVAQIDLMLGDCYERRGENDRALAHYRDASRLMPGSKAAEIGVAQALAARGSYDEALAHFKQVLPKDPAVGVRVAQLLLLQNQKVEPEKRQWEEFNQVLDNAALALPSSTEITMLRARGLVAQNQTPAAFQLLSEARDVQPGNIELWLGLSSLLEAAGQLDKALETLDKAGEKLGDRIELRLARAMYWAKPEREGAAGELAKLLDDSNRFTLEEESQLLRGLAEAYLRVGKTEEAKNLWTQVAAKQPKDLRVRLFLSDLALQAGDDKALARLIDEIRQIEGEEGVYWRYVKATRIAAQARAGDRSHLADARALLAEVATLRPSWGAVPAREGEVYDLEGNQQLAVQKFRTAIELGERNPNIYRRAIQLLLAQGQPQEAGQLLAKLQEQGPLTGELQRLQASVSMQNNDPQGAIAAARKAIEDGSKDPRDHLWLAQVLTAAGQKDEAKEWIGKSIQLPEADKQAEVWVTAVILLARLGDVIKAEAMIKEAQEKLSSDAAPLALAQCYEVLNRLDKAEEQYRAALKAKPGDINVLRSAGGFYWRYNQLALAEPLLSKMLDPQLQASKSDQLWARRGLALRWATSGEYQHYLKARQAIEQNIKEGGTVEDLRAKATILSTRPGQQPEAVRILEGLRGRESPNPEQELILADLYQKTRKWPMAKEIYTNLGMQSSSPAAVALSAARLLRKGEAAGAESWLERLQKMEPESLRTLEVQVLVLARAQGKAEEAGRLLTEYALKPEANLDFAAALLEEIGQTAGAEEIFRKFTAPGQKPEKVLSFMGFLTRQGRTQEALDLAERVWKTLPAEQAATATMAVLNAAKPASPDQCQRALHWFEDARQKNGDSLALLMHLAALRQLQQKYSEADQLYRQILLRSDRNPIAMNNLAWLIALENGKKEEALDLINRAIELVGPVAELLDTRAVVNLMRGKPELAIGDLRTALDEAPSATRYFHLARAQLEMKNPRAAQASLQDAKELHLTRESIHPLEQQAYDRLVQVLEREKEGS